MNVQALYSSTKTDEQLIADIADGVGLIDEHIMRRIYTTYNVIYDQISDYEVLDALRWLENMFIVMDLRGITLKNCAKFEREYKTKRTIYAEMMKRHRFAPSAILYIMNEDGSISPEIEKIINSREWWSCE